ncbi:hypothetical protein REPUB_Repub13aG0161800 [Reevesia pubescens]
MGNMFSFQPSCDTIITRCWDCAAGQAAFLCKLEENLDALKTELAELNALRNDMMRRVKIAEDQPQLKRLDQVQDWLLRSETVINEADLLVAESPQEINKLCMGGCCSTNPKSNHQFGKRIAKKLEEVKDQKSKGVFEMVADKVPMPLATQRPSEPTVGLESTFNKVWSSLQEEKVGILGLYGMGGVGKTTLLSQINNKFHDTPNDFDYVIWVVASQDLQIEKVQEEIGKRIGFLDEAWKSKRLDEKAVDILSVLCKKKFALFLDDIWDWVDLTRVGVPFPTHENGSKIVFTTRLIDVCFQMGANKRIKVECLPQPEALKLFEDKVGEETLDRHPDIRKLAEELAEECAGLPLALITIGRAMASKKTPEEWKYAIEVLRRSAASVFPGVGKEMYPKLKFSYDCLTDDTVRSCFLYCSLYPEDYLIEKSVLIDCWIGEGFLDERTNLSSVKNQGHYIIGSLIDACLLEEEGNGFVKMHDVIRDMSLWIAGESEKEKFFVQAGVQLTEQPEAEKWEKVRRVSLMKNQIENLTEILVCPNLQTLFLGRNKLKVIINDFFKFMPMLRVLDLSLNLDLEELPVGIAKLVSLEHLNLSHTNIRKLPVELKALEKLKCLNLEMTYSLKLIPQQLISSFSKLQVLRMYGYCYGKSTDTGIEDKTKLQVMRLYGYGNGKSNDAALEDKTTFGKDEWWLVEEMQGLKYLNALTISFKSASMLERALGSQKFQSCAVEAVMLDFFRGSRVLNILALANMQHLNFLVLMDCEDLEEVKIEGAGLANAGCFHSLRFVKLIRCSKLRDATWVILAPHLKFLLISRCQDFVEIISHEKLGEVAELAVNLNLFSKLESLLLAELPEMKTIYRDALPFPHLKELIIEECPKLRKLSLNSDSAKGQKILIQGKEEWWKDLEWEDESTRNALLPSFKPLS